MKFGKAVVKYRVPILIASILLLIPAALGALGTRINYDVLSYLPKNIEIMKVSLPFIVMTGLVLEGIYFKNVTAENGQVSAGERTEPGLCGKPGAERRKRGFDGRNRPAPGWSTDLARRYGTI